MYNNKVIIGVNTPTVFTYRLSENDGWVESLVIPTDYESVMYIGTCASNGDMFSCTTKEGHIYIHCGYLNSGVY
jgi:hypothetical protein